MRATPYLLRLHRPATARDATHTPAAPAVTRSTPVHRTAVDHGDVRTTRRISFPTHGAIEFALGGALMAAPFVLGAGVAGTAVAVALGVLVAGVALTSIGDGRSAPLSLRAHESYDQALGGAGVACAVGLSAAGEEPAGIAVLALCVALLLLSQVTRYSAR
jgi:hypothetical protein